MAKHGRFKFKDRNELFTRVHELGVELPFTEDIDILFDSVAIAEKQLPNRFVVHPMEGFDSKPDGAPGELTFRRYKKYAAGGSALIWFEATAVVPEARSNPMQLQITPDTVDVFKELVEATRKAAHQSIGSQHDPMLILQLTHSGRYSKPQGKIAPIIAHHSKILDPLYNLPEDYPLITDAELDQLQDVYVNAARLAARAGFDGVDIKSCHRYLVSELLASFTRENSRYGGSFENRTRFLTEVARRITNEVTGIFVTTRMNVYDAIRYPYGFGVAKNDYRKPDLDEPIKLIATLVKIGIPVLNVSIGNPYYNPHFGRPFDFTIKGGKIPDLHPLEGIELFLKITRDLQQAHQDLPVIGSGYSWLRYFLPNVGAEVLKRKWATLIGVGRGALAYPDFVKDLMTHRKMEPYKCCIACSSCTQIMRDGGSTGCVIHDKEIYRANYRLGRRFAPDRLQAEAERCRDCQTPFCKRACPAEMDIPAFIKAYADGHIEKAYAVMTEKNPLPEICAYVCPAEVQCEANCVEKILTNTAVAIQDIQRALAQQARMQGITRLTLPDKPASAKVAVIGAGVAGIACSIALLRQGYRLTIFDANTEPGGLVRHTIPPYRIPYNNADIEFNAIFESVSQDRFEKRFNTPLTPDYNLDAILEQYDAVFLAMGLPQGKTLAPKPYTNLVSALQFLEEAKRKGQVQVPQTVAIIGGGNTGMDAAITAKQNGARDVYMICFESFTTMPAWLSERQEALLTGISFMNLFMPKGYTAEHGRITAVKVSHVRLAEPDADNFCAPVEIPATEFDVKVDLVIEALGQKPPDNLTAILPGIKLTKNNLVAIAADSHVTSRDGVFAGGDMVNGGLTAVRAVADGLAAANEIDDYLKKKGKK